ncbi:polygalacturonase [Chitinophaga sp. SYP-B3965]|uniref:glycoside hydrolase family 28 protein n=1 Tax=Chitinophaga sp. SYP-B3965 TaxID=2663120 RepID=UPI001299797F|nr:glycosyl hydrolase family 28 protein [Chitinophaga sp. SYP-B3965]MRG48609.1 polygalacturonase [Chitinophaga sp. SYP-B3965]
MKCKNALLLFTLISFHAKGNDFNILDFGAIRDTSKLSTLAINKTIEACFKAGGGRVIIPAGNFKSGTITLLNNVELFLERGAVLYGSTDHHDYPRQQQPAYRSQKDPGGWYALIYAESASNIGISGFGTIDGQGARQVPRPGPKGAVHEDRDGRPRNILFISCQKISVQDITMQNSGIWNQHYLNCENVVINNIRVYNHSNRNNDAIDLDGCRHVVVSNSIMDTDDDGITLKSTGAAPCEDIAITNCIVSSFCAAIKCGTESTGGFKNILISNCIVRPSSCPTAPIFRTPRIGQVGIALEVVDGGIMDGVTVSNIIIEGTECPIYVRLGNRARKHTDEAPEPPPGKMRNISLSNINVYGAGNYSSSITGIPGSPIENITLNNIRIVNRGGLKQGEYRSEVAELEKEYPAPDKWGNLPSSGFFIRHVNDIALFDITLRSLAADPRTPVIADDVDHLHISDLRSDRPAAKTVQLLHVRTFKQK